MIAHVTNHTARELDFTFGDVHIYDNHVAQVELLLTREPYASPTLKINDSAQHLHTFINALSSFAAALADSEPLSFQLLAVPSPSPMRRN
jgi:hypothetical protein